MSSNIVLIDKENMDWNGDFIIPFWIVFDSKYKYKMTVRRDKFVSVDIIEIGIEDDMGHLLDKNCFDFESYEVWSNNKYYHVEEALINKTDRLRFINIRAKGNGYARIIFEQVSNDNKHSHSSIELDEID